MIQPFYQQAPLRHWLSLLICLIVSLGIGPLGIFAQSFQQTTLSSFSSLPAQVNGGDIVWGDFDADGDLDILQTGTLNGFGNFLTEIYAYDNVSDQFTPLGLGTNSIPQVRDSRCTWGDYDNDGDLDLLVVGQDAGGTRYAQIYRYSSLTGYSTLGMASINAILSTAAVSDGAAAFADYNNDGYLDIVIAGNQNTTPTLQLFRNQGPSGVIGFAADTTLPGISSPSISWGDYDNDADLDLLICGSNSIGNPVTKLYGNSGNGNFLDIASAPFPNVREGSVEWGDYDNDGDLDALIAGDNGLNPICALYKNDGASGFNLVNVSLSGITQGEATWVDYNFDGWLDIFLVGQNGTSGTNRTAELYRNTQNGTFSLENSLSAIFPPLNGGARAAWGDFNGDEKLDVMVSGTTDPNVFTTQVFTNNLAGTKPNLLAPRSLSASQAGTSVNFFWQAPNGIASEIEQGLSYNLYLIENNSGDFVRGPEASISTGKRWLASFGAIKDTFWRVSGLTPGTYTWSVQAVDAGLEGGIWASSANFTYTSPFGVTSLFSSELGTRFPAIPGPPVGVDNARLVWGDLNNDNHLDFVIQGNDNGGTAITTVYFYNPTTNQFDADDIAIPANFRFGDIALGDCDNDGDLDIAISGLLTSAAALRLYQNNNGSFSPISISGINLDNINGSLDWGDYDNDGDLDLLVTGNNLFHILPNTLEDQPNTFGTPFKVDAGLSLLLSDAQFGDYNRDNYPDILVSGQNGGSGLITRVYQNQGDGTFSDQRLSIPGLLRTQVEWADINNDGDLDFMACGLNVSGTPTVVARTYERAADAFVTFDVSTITPAGYGSLDFGDFNDDGWADLVIAGQVTNSTLSRATKVYFNNADPSNLQFVEDVSSSATLIDLNNGVSAAWGDYDGDNKLDLALAGRALSGPVFNIYHNDDLNPNATLDPPFQVRHQVEGFNVRISWLAPRTSNPTTKEGLSYAVYLRKMGSPDTLIRYIAAETGTPNNGFRRNVNVGNASQATELLLENVQPGTYFYAVQAIDQDAEGSSFSAEQSFTFSFPSFEDSTQAYFPLGKTPLRDATVALGDYTNDGYLDLCMAGVDDNGQRQTKLYFFDPSSHQFVPDLTSEGALADVRQGSISWGDVNNDGRLDLLLTGNTSGGAFSRIYLNTLGTFNNNPGQVINLVGIQNGKGAFFDYDNDGFQDLFLIGQGQGGSPIVKIYQHNQSAQTNPYQDVANLGVFPALESADVAFGDYNNDSYLDVLISGNTGTARRSALFTNNQLGGFTATPVPALENIDESSVEWVDYNNDGWLDVVLSGRNNSAPRTLLLENQAGGGFVASGNFQGIRNGVASWCDYNLDGWSDLFLAGNPDNGTNRRSSLLYRNPGSTGNFTQDNVASAPLIHVNNGAGGTWGDLNQDGKPDLILVGQRFSSPDSGTLQVLINIADATPRNFGSPTNLNESISGFEVKLNWDMPANVPGLDPEVVKGLSYNLLVGTSPGTINQRSPLSRTSSGTRQVVQRGQVNDTTSFRLRKLLAGTYYWRVQAIDQDLAGTPFSSQGSFTYEPPAFVDSSATSFAVLPNGLYHGDLAWADIDADGDLDLAVAGQTPGGPLLEIYVNTNGQLSPASLGLTGLAGGDLAWGDINNDNLPDLLACGTDGGGSPQTILYQNNGNGTFSELSTPLYDVAEGAVAWIDIDGDGDQDIIVSGDTGSTLVMEGFENEGGSLTELRLGLTGLTEAAIGVTDFDLNHFQDVLLTGADENGNPSSRLLLNTGTGSFDLKTGATAGLIDIRNGGVDIADVDLDGVPDVLLSGENTLGAPITQIFRFNDATQVFQNANLPTTGLTRGQAKFGDYNDDGRIDFVATGQSQTATQSLLYTQQVNGTFLEESVLSLGIPDLQRSALAWGDFNQDGKLDLSIIGSTDQTNQVQLFRLLSNTDLTNPNSPPNPPANPTVSIDADTVILRWEAPSNSAGYTYQLSVARSSPGDAVSPLAGSDGRRFIVQRGSVGEATTAKLVGLADGNYTWQVQAIGPDYEGSTFISGGPFEYVEPIFIDDNELSVGDNVPTFSEATTVWGDVDDDGDLDAWITGQSTTPKALILRNINKKLTYDASLDIQLDDLEASSLAIADYNNDGKLDVILSGVPIGGDQPVIRLYFNNGGSLTLDPKGQDLPGVANGVLAWGDVNQDGFQDLMIAGTKDGAGFTGLYIQHELGFAPYPYTSFPNLSRPAIAFADVDGDQDLDLALAGDQNGTPQTYIYLNRGALQGFTAVTSPTLPGVVDGSLAWGNREGDNDLDLLVCGETETGSVITQIIRLQNNVFQLDPASLVGVTNGQALWGDIDNDGDQDILLSGELEFGNAGALVYLNDGSGVFMQDLASSNALAAPSPASMAWTDINQDKNLDISLVGSVNGQPSLVVYRNIDPTVNNIPAPPTNLQTSIQTNAVDLSWLDPANGTGMSYNLFLGTKDDPQSQVGALAQIQGSPSGLRKIKALGNAGPSTSFTLTNLPGGTYYWSVQAVGPDYEGSAFSQIDSFEYDPVLFVDETAVLLDDLTLGGVNQGDLAWGDYDQDGDLDLLVIGEGDATLLNCSDNGRFEIDPANTALLPDLTEASALWFDFDQSGGPDLLLSGNSGSTPEIRVFTSDNRSLTQRNTTLPALKGTRMVAGDFNQDGRTDIAYIGTTASGDPSTIVRQNNGSLGFRNLSSGFAAFVDLHQGDIAYADLNGDGFGDLVTIGTNDQGQHAAYVYLHDRIQGFRRLDNAFVSLTAVENVRIAVGDYDNDGYPDLAVTGRNLSGAETPLQVFHNEFPMEPTQPFQSITLSPILEGAQGGDIQWGDWNADGQLDLMYLGTSENDVASISLLLQQNGVFALDSLATADLLPLRSGGALSPADFNQDGRLDLALSGRRTNNSLAIAFLRNQYPDAKTAPPTPTDLFIQGVGSDLRLSWTAPVDASPDLVDGYTYNIFIGVDDSDTDSTDRINPLSAIGDGYRQVVRQGNGSYQTQVTISDLEVGNDYVWGVQTIDQQYQGSAFVKSKFSYRPPSFEDRSDNAFSVGGSDTRPLALVDGDVLVGDYNQDNALDVIITGIETATNIRKTLFYLNQPGQGGKQTFVLDVDNSSIVPGLTSGDLTWIDIDQDNDLDLYVHGLSTSPSSGFAALYLNAGGSFSLDPRQSLVPLKQASASTADYDGDGDTDLFVVGRDNDEQPRSILYENVAGVLTPRASLGNTTFTPLAEGAVAWGDFNKTFAGDDINRPDLFICGRTSSGNIQARIYENKGISSPDDPFRLISAPEVRGVINGEASMFDLDGDGPPELIVHGTDANGQPSLHTYYFGNGANILSLEHNLDSISSGDVLIGDVDHDPNQLADVLIAGEKNGQRVIKLYRNKSLPVTVAGAILTFVEDPLTSQDLDSAKIQTLSYGDINDDQKLDLISASGQSFGMNTPEVSVFYNIDENPSIPIGLVGGLQREELGADMKFSWERLDSSYTYHFFLEEKDSGTNLWSPVGDLGGGNRYTVDVGNMGPNTQVTVIRLTSGTFRWGVQAVGPDFEGGLYSFGDEFSFIQPIPEINPLSIPPQYNDGGDPVIASATVADTSLVQAVIIRYKPIADSIWRQDVQPVNSTQYEFSMSLANERVDEIGCEYFFIAQGKFGGYTDETDTFYTYRYYANGINESSLRTGRQAVDYNLISIPLMLDDSSVIANIGDEFGRYGPYRWRFWHYDPMTENTTEYDRTGGGGIANFISPGRGYWILSKTDNTYRTISGQAVEANDMAPYPMTLQQGWNQIGNPFNFNVFWPDVRKANPGVNAKLFVFQAGSGFDSAQILSARRGGFVFVDTSTTLLVPVRKNPQAARRVDTRRLMAHGKLSGPNWRLPLHLSSSNRSFGLAAIGMNPEALESKDGFDDILPPRFGPVLDMYTYHAEYFAPAFTADIVPTKDQFIWEFTVQSNLGEDEIILSWPEIEKEGQKDLFLFDEEEQQYISMTDQLVYHSLSDQAKRTFKIIYGDPDFVQQHVQPSRLHLGRIYPNPAQGPIQIRAAIPTLTVAIPVEVSLWDMKGRKLETIVTQTMKGGHVTWKWDPRHLSSGVYTITLTGVMGGKVEQMSRKVVIRS